MKMKSGCGCKVRFAPLKMKIIMPLAPISNLSSNILIRFFPYYGCAHTQLISFDDSMIINHIDSAIKITFNMNEFCINDDNTQVEICSYI